MSLYETTSLSPFDLSQGTTFAEDADRAGADAPELQVDDTSPVKCDFLAGNTTIIGMRDYNTVTIKRGTLDYSCSMSMSAAEAVTLANVLLAHAAFLRSTP